MHKESLPDDRRQSLYSDEGRKSNEKGRSHSNNVKESSRYHKLDHANTSVGKDDNNHSGAFDSGSEENGKHKTEGRKHKRSERQESVSDDDQSYDSERDDRKEAKNADTG